MAVTMHAIEYHKLFENSFFYMIIQIQDWYPTWLHISVVQYNVFLYIYIYICMYIY